MGSLTILIGIGGLCVGFIAGFIVRYVFAKIYANSVPAKSLV